MRTEANHIEESLNFPMPCGPIALVFVEFVIEGGFYCLPLNKGSSGIGESYGSFDIHQENSNFLKLTYFSLISKLSKIKQIFIKEPLCKGTTDAINHSVDSS